jgi:hypothetical protein
MPSKKPARAATATASARRAPAPLKTPDKTPERMAPPFGRTASLIVAGCVVAGGILFAARQQAQPLLTTTPRQEAVPAPEVRASHVVTSNAPAASATASSSSAATPSAAKAAPVTITGCLEVDNDTFRLKDTAGADAPKSRSWKSGFMKKGQAKIELVASPGANLASQVGRRVSVTGTLDDREMQVRSVRRVAASCEVK